MSNIDKISIYKIYSINVKKQKEKMENEKKLKISPHKIIKNK